MPDKPESNFVERYFSSIGMKKPRSSKTFWARIEKRFGEQGQAFSTIIDRRESGADVDPYAIKNSSLEMSIEISSQYDSPRIKSYLKWFVAESITNLSTIVDLGCENGIITCAYANLFPNARVIGIDRSRESLAIARELAAKLQLTNIEFRLIEGTENDFGLNGIRADVISATFFFHEKMPFTAETTDFEFLESRLPEHCDEQVAALALLRTHLTPAGRLITLDRWASPQATWRWHNLCAQAGFSVSLRDSYMLQFSGVGGNQYAPVTVAYAETGRTKTTQDLSLAFYAYRGLVDRAEDLHVDHGPAAEVIWRGLNSGRLLFRGEAIFRDDSGTERIDIVASGPLLAQFSYSTTGFREIWLTSSILFPELLQQAEKYVSTKSPHAHVSTHLQPLGLELLKNLGIEVTPDAVDESA